MFGASANEIKAILTAEDRSYTSTMQKAMGATSTLSQRIKRCVGIGAAFEIGQRAIGAAMNAVSSNVGNAIARYDQLNRFPQTLNNLGISTKAAEKATKELSKGIDGLPTTLDAATQGVSRFVSSNGDIKKSTKYFLAMNNAIIAGGSSVEIQSSAIEQLSQAYSKGKMDMMEWRSIQTAMPGQLNQIAKAMNMSTSELGEGLRSGTVSMDEFMDTMVRLNNEGVDGFSSFADQAQTSVGGIQTAMSLIQSAITRGLANCIGSIDKMLESNGMPKIAEMAIMLRDKINVAFEGIQKAMMNVDLKGIVEGATPYWNLFKKVLEGTVNTIKTVGGFLLEHSAIIARIAPALMMASGAVSGFVGAIKGYKALKEFGKELNTLKTDLQKLASQEKITASVTAASNKVIEMSGVAYGKIKSSISMATGAVLNFAKANKVAMISALGIVGPIIALAVYMAKTGKSADEMASDITTFANKLASGITQFANELPNMLNSIMPAITKGINAVISTLPTLIPALITAGLELFMSLVESLTKIIDPLVAALPSIVTAIVKALPILIPALINAGVVLFMALVKAIPKIIPPLVAGLPKIIKSTVSALISGREQLKQVGIQLLKSLLAGMVSLFGTITSRAFSFAKQIPSKIKSGLGSLTSAGSHLIQGLWNGMKSKFSSAISWAKNQASKLPKAVKKVLGIKSPSRVMMSVGEYFSEGLAIGISSMSRTVTKAAEGIVNIPQVMTPQPMAFSMAGYNGSLDIERYNYADMNYTFVVETNIDGKKAAEALVPHATPIMERNQQRTNRSRGIR